MKTNTSDAAAETLAEEIEANPIYKVGLPLAKRILRLLDFGLSMGMGVPAPGQMCVEAAVAYAMGENHNDHPKCVKRSVARVKIALNDNGTFDGDIDRARILRRVAIAQLGSIEPEFDEVLFIKFLGRELVRRCAPAMIRAELSSTNSRAIILNRFENNSPQRAIDICFRQLERLDKIFSSLHETLGAADDRMLLALGAIERVLEKLHACLKCPYVAIDMDVLVDRRQTRLVAEAIVLALRRAKSPGIKLMDKLCPIPAK